MSAEWREKEGFGFSTPKPDDLWSPHDEHLADYDRTLDRMAHWLATGGEDREANIVSIRNPA